MLQTPQNDATLIDSAKNGNVKAFNRLMERWQQRVYSYVLNMCGDADDAFDLTQKTFIKVYEGLPHLEFVERFPSWLFRIATNQYRDSLRNKHKKRTQSFEALQEEVGFEVSSDSEEGKAFHADIRVQATELKVLLKHALQRIPEEQRLVVVMKEYQGLKFREIAEILNESENTVKSRLYYGLRNLKNVFDQWNIDKNEVGYEL